MQKTKKIINKTVVSWVKFKSTNLVNIQRLTFAFLFYDEES